jgi:hypothetical protein
MHSSRYRRETSRCMHMHNMHVICIYNRLRWYFGIAVLREEVRCVMMNHVRSRYAVCDASRGALCVRRSNSGGYSTVKRHLVMAGAQ